MNSIPIYSNHFQTPLDSISIGGLQCAAHEPQATAAKTLQASGIGLHAENEPYQMSSLAFERKRDLEDS